MSLSLKPHRVGVAVLLGHLARMMIRWALVLA
jgi:hypothetical protein